MGSHCFKLNGKGLVYENDFIFKKKIQISIKNQNIEIGPV